MPQFVDLIRFYNTYVNQKSLHSETEELNHVNSGRETAWSSSQEVCAIRHQENYRHTEAQPYTYHLTTVLPSEASGGACIFVKTRSH